MWKNIRKYQISLVGYLSEKERQQQQTLALAEDYPAVPPMSSRTAAGDHPALFQVSRR